MVEYGKAGCAAGFFLWLLAIGLVVLIALAAGGAL